MMAFLLLQTMYITTLHRIKLREREKRERKREEVGDSESSSTMIVKLRDAGVRVLRQKRDVLRLIDFCDDRYVRSDAFVGTYEYRKFKSITHKTKQS